MPIAVRLHPPNTHTVVTCHLVGRYLVFACGHNNYKTAVVKKTTNPVWNEVFTWTLGAGENHSVTVDMFDHDVLGPKCVRCAPCCVPLCLCL